MLDADGGLIVQNHSMTALDKDEKINAFIGSWMLEVLSRDYPSADAWAKKAGVASTNITRLVNIKTGIVNRGVSTPSGRTLSKLAAVASLPLVLGPPLDGKSRASFEWLQRMSPDQRRVFDAHAVAIMELIKIG